MRITRIEIHSILPPYQDFNATTLSRYHGRAIQERTILVVRTDTGLEGYGETWGRLHGGEALQEKYAGTSPFDWINDQTSLAMDMALYDLMGKHLGVPAWKLLGQQVRSWVPVAAWTVSQAPLAMAEEVRRAARQGYCWLKYHVDEVQNVIDQTEAMQQAAPPGFKIHYDFNANSTYYAMRPILAELERFPVAGRFEDVLPSRDEDGYRLLREQSQRPIIAHHAPPEFMVKKLAHGYMAGHAPLGLALKLGAVAELTNTPIMLQQCGGTINQAFLAHEAAVLRMATIDHVDLCHLWKEDVTAQTMPVVGGSVQVPEGPGLGVKLDREKLERCCLARPLEPGRFLVRLRYADGLTVYLRHDPQQPGATDNLRFHERLHHFGVPGPPPSYASAVVADFWEGKDDPAEFERRWQQTAQGPAWVQEKRETP
jgi:L-alanine-DL-glutamate epimerase-like enolase superfamily enzyme